MSSHRESRVWLSLSASVIAALALVPGLFAEEGRQAGQAFDRGETWQVHLRLSPEEYAAMQPRSSSWFPALGNLFKPKEQPPQREVRHNNFGMDLPWAKGDVTVNGETFKNVGVRYKGNGTISDAAGTIKKSLKVELDHFGGAARHDGRKTINLHCGVADPSKLRETLGYALYRAAGVPAPRTAFAEVRLTVPGKYDQELLGLYTVVEPVDKAFLRDRFGTDQGLLMKPDRLRDFEHKGDDWGRYKSQYLPKREPTAAESKRVIAFARLIHQADDATFRKEIGAYLDVDAYLRYLAATAFVSNTDSMFALGHNYYVYLHPKTGKFHLIPWDLDRAFANLPFFGSKRQQMNLSFRHPYAGPHKLNDRLLAMPGTSEQYDKLLQELAAGPFQRERLLKEVASLTARTRDLFAQDAKAAAARKDYAHGSHLNALLGQPPELPAFFIKRTDSLAAQLAGQSKGHVPTGGAGPGFPHVGHIMAGRLMDEFDADQDGRLSKDEWRGLALKVYDACDKDDMGRVNQKAIAGALEKLFPKPPEGAPKGPFGGFTLGNFMAGPIAKRADANKDGTVTRAELLAATDQLFDQFDKDKGGSISEDSFGKLLTELFPMPNFAPPPRPPAGKPGTEAKKP